MAKNQEKEKIEVSKRHWKRTVKEAFKTDQVRIIIELIKNSADSYYRLWKRNEAEPPFKIWVTVKKHTGDTPSIIVKDHAEGMRFEDLKEALVYGTETTDYVGSAEKGIGLKDSLMAMAPNGKITTIKNDKISSYKIPEVGYKKPIRRNEKVSKNDREKLGMPDNGTLVRGKTPEYFKPKKFDSIKRHLSNHFLLRKLLQREEYEIYLINGWSEEKRKLMYEPPELDETLLEDTFTIEHEGNSYEASMKINRSKEELKKRKPLGKAGLILYYGNYTVLDSTLGDYKNDPATYRIFGEVKLDIRNLLTSEGEILVDQKRKGLDPTHDFNEKLLGQVNEKVKKLIEKEKKESKYDVDSGIKEELLKKVNDLYEAEVTEGKGPQSTPRSLPVKPETFDFAKPYMEIEELEEEINYLVVNSEVVPPEGLKIKLGTDNSDITINRGEEFLIDKDDFDDNEYIIKQIPVVCEKAGTEGEILATT